MAVRKLPPALFSAKNGVAEPDCSTSHLHFIASTTRRRNQFVFVCESQPLLTIRSYGLPSRCPICGVPNPLEKDVLGDSLETRRDLP